MYIHRREGRNKYKPTQAQNQPFVESLLIKIAVGDDFYVFSFFRMQIEVMKTFKIIFYQSHTHTPAAVDNNAPLHPQNLLKIK